MADAQPPSLDLLASRFVRQVGAASGLQGWIDNLPKCDECGYVVSTPEKLNERRYHSPECSRG